MNSTLDTPVTKHVYSDGSECPRNHCVQIDNVVDTFQILFHDQHDAADLKTVMQQFHDVVDVVDDHDKRFIVRIRSMPKLTSGRQRGLDADSVRHIFNPFYPITSIAHTFCLVVARKP